MTTPALAEQLLDAQVAWVCARVTGDEQEALIDRLVDDAVRIAETTAIADLVEADRVTELTRLLLTRVPAAAVASTMAETGARIVYDNPAGEYTLRGLIDRENVERLTDEILALTPSLERILDDLTRSPLVAALASRFVGRIVNDVLAGNRAVAEKIPGVGSLVSLGSSVAGKAIGKTGEQFGELFGDTAAKGAEFAMSRLNKIIVTTLNDPQTRTAVLEVFDLYADRPAGRNSEVVDLDDAVRIAGLAQDIAIAGAAAEPVLALVDAFVHGFFATYAEHPAAVLIDDLGLTRDDLHTQARALLPRLLDAAAASGELEAMVRAELAPFYASPEVLELLGD